MRYLKKSIAVFFILLTINAALYFYMLKSTKEIIAEAGRICAIAMSGNVVDAAADLDALDKKVTAARRVWEITVSHNDTEEAAAALKAALGYAQSGEPAGTVSRLRLFIFYVENTVQKIRPDAASIL